MISRESQDEAEVVEVEVRHGERLRVRRGGADRALRRDRPRRRSPGSRRSSSATTRGRSTRSRLRCRPASRPRARRSTRRSTTCRGSSPACRCYQLLGLRRDGPPTSWTVWLGDPDDMARRAEAAAQRGFRRLKLKLGGARRARPRARARRARRDRRCRSRSTSTSTGRSTRRSSSCRRCRSSTASSRSPPAIPAGPS